MTYFQMSGIFASNVALLVVISRLIASLVTKGRNEYISAICVGIGFVVGSYYADVGNGNFDDPVAITKLAGGVISLLILGAGFRYQALRSGHHDRVSPSR